MSAFGRPVFAYESALPKRLSSKLNVCLLLDVGNPNSGISATGGASLVGVRGLVGEMRMSERVSAASSIVVAATIAVRVGLVLELRFLPSLDVDFFWINTWSIVKDAFLPCQLALGGRDMANARD